MMLTEKDWVTLELAGKVRVVLLKLKSCPLVALPPAKTTSTEVGLSFGLVIETEMETEPTFSATVWALLVNAKLGGFDTGSSLSVMVRVKEELLIVAPLDGFCKVN